MRSALAWWRRLAVVALASVLLNACGRQAGIQVYNQTDRTVEILYVEGAKEMVVAHGLGPGQQVPIGGFISRDYPCTRGDLVARDASGAEVARRTEPICEYEKWVITLQSPSPT